MVLFLLVLIVTLDSVSVEKRSSQIRKKGGRREMKSAKKKSIDGKK